MAFEMVLGGLVCFPLELLMCSSIGPGMMEEM